jgi:hypothetical protein
MMTTDLTPPINELRDLRQTLALSGRVPMTLAALAIAVGVSRSRMCTIRRAGVVDEGLAGRIRDASKDGVGEVAEWGRSVEVREGRKRGRKRG